LEEESTHEVLSCFLGVGNGNDLEKRFLADETVGDVFALFWEAMVVPEMEAFLCFQE